MRCFQWHGGALTEQPASLPEGSYTTLRTYGGRRVLRLDQHVRRLLDSVAELGRPGRLEAQEVRRAVAAALTATGHAESRVRLIFAPPRLFLEVDRFEPLAAELYRAGVACATLSLRRDHPHAKDTRFLAAADLARSLLPQGAHEGLLVTEDGAILEGLSSNFFAVLDGQIRTEQDRALAGVTRSLVLELAGGVLPVALAPVVLADLPRLSEAFITSVSRGILPVVAIDGSRVGAGRPGSTAAELGSRLEALVAREAEPLA
jgi:branched-chain amino acid aminotransferase